MKKVFFIAIALMAVIMVAGCRKYQTPEFEEVNTSETAFVVPLEGDSDTQVKLDSEKAYDNYKVMEKRIVITKRWNQTGRLWFSGEWIPTIRVIKVERTPVTREWTVDSSTGTKNKDQAIWVESSDSVGFSIGFNCTTHIQESEASKFLYWYKGNTLASVMDQEVRNRIQQVASEVAAKYILDSLREKKLEIIAEVRKDLIPYFAIRGITITTVGMFGGFEYENPKIQEAIDAVFIAQQLKNEEKAKLSAMEDQKKRMDAEGEAAANKARQIAKGTADGILLVKEAEAKGITVVNDALEKAKGNPMFVQIKMLEVEEKRIDKWNGSVPQWTTGDSGFVPMIQISARTPAVSNKK